MAKTFKTPQDYLESIQDGRVVYADGEKITNVVEHPITRKGALAYATEYERFHDPEVRKVFTTTDLETGEPTDLFLVHPRNADDLIRRARALEYGRDMGHGSALALSDAILSLSTFQAGTRPPPSSGLGSTIS
ncbi:MAG: 4-hydroxyphenylacetate 3-hydroxylase N-terminal domain-containing protein [Dehalococcoidia bacterium]